MVLALCVVLMGRDGVLASDSTVAGLITAAGRVNALVWWLTFLPPTAYLRWVQGRAAAEASNG